MKKLRRLAALLLALVMVFSAFTSVSAAGVTLPSALTVIEDEAFAGSDLFKGLVQIPFDVTQVGSNVFADSDVYALEIPLTVEKLGDHTGQELAYVYFNSCVLPSLPENFNTRYVFGDNGNALM